MSWSWSNPSSEDAQEAYDYYKGKYNSAANQKIASQNKENRYISDRKNAVSDKNACISQKINFEKRLEGIEKIIKMLEGNGGWFSADVPEDIEKAQKALSKVDSSFRGCIKMTGGVSAASLEEAFEIKSVESDSNSASALQAFRNEKSRLEQEIENLKKKINELSSLVDSLTKQIRACDAEQRALQASMNSYAYDMNHYKKYID